MNGCHNRAPYKAYHLPTGTPDIPQYRILHVMRTEWQYTKTALGQADTKCFGCKHLKEMK